MGRCCLPRGPALSLCISLAFRKHTDTDRWQASPAGFDASTCGPRQGERRNGSRRHRRDVSREDRDRSRSDSRDRSSRRGHRSGRGYRGSRRSARSRSRSRSHSSPYRSRSPSSHRPQVDERQPGPTTPCGDQVEEDNAAGAGADSRPSVSTPPGTGFGAALETAHLAHPRETGVPPLSPPETAAPATAAMQGLRAGAASPSPLPLRRETATPATMQSPRVEATPPRHCGVGPPPLHRRLCRARATGRHRRRRRPLSRRTNVEGLHQPLLARTPSEGHRYRRSVVVTAPQPPPTPLVTPPYEQLQQQQQQ